MDLLAKGKNPLSYYILYNESKHNILALVGEAKNWSSYLVFPCCGSFVLFESTAIWCRSGPSEPACTSAP
jgi:hypothetical protein